MGVAELAGLAGSKAMFPVVLPLMVNWNWPAGELALIVNVWTAVLVVVAAWMRISLMIPLTLPAEERLSQKGGRPSTYGSK